MMRRRASYLLSALVLSAGAPLGLLLLRLVRAREATLARAMTEVAADFPTYLYVALSTATAFTAFAYVLGRRADQLYEASTTDALTGLRNRRVVDERLEEEMARTRRYRTALSVLLIDIDGLKEVNDRKGHRAGDLTIREAAAAVRRGSRATDVTARWGGDEFIVLAPNTALPDARQLGERIRLLAAEGREAPGGLTLSIGVSTCRDTDAGGEAVVRRADAALYEAKRRGRNRVVTG
jgi:diguanylate cyclase (GGDEF)-like protein